TGLRARWEKDRDEYERLFDEVAAVVEEGARAAEGGDLARLGEAFDQNQELLRALGVSAPEVERLVAAARVSGALGAKLTGGGAGLGGARREADRRRRGRGGDRARGRARAPVGDARGAADTDDRRARRRGGGGRMSEGGGGRLFLVGGTPPSEGLAGRVAQA